MLYKHSHLLKDLRATGRTAPAEILGMHTEGSYSEMRSAWADDSDLTTGGTLCRLELRVMPPGEPPFEKTIRTRLNTFKYTGDTIEVLYDPDDHERVAFDYEADAQRVMQRNARHVDPDAGALDPELQQLMDMEEAERARSTASADGSGLPEAASPPPSSSHEDDRVARLTQLADLHDRGALTDAEFAAEKARILSEP